MKKFFKPITYIASLALLSSTALAGGYQYAQPHSYNTQPSVNYHYSGNQHSSYQQPYNQQPAYQQTPMYKQSSYQKSSYPTVVDAAVASPNLSTLVTALKTAGLVSALQSGGPFIVFAPTNQAFNQLPPGKLNSLLEPQNRSQLQSVLKYHVVPADFKTLQGQKLKVAISRVNQAHVIKTVKTGNGVVYVIDQVLVP